jgi:hypothetical protein
MSTEKQQATAAAIEYRKNAVSQHVAVEALAHLIVQGYLGNESLCMACRSRMGVRADRTSIRDCPAMDGCHLAMLYLGLPDNPNPWGDACEGCHQEQSDADDKREARLREAAATRGHALEEEAASVGSMYDQRPAAQRKRARLW